MNYATVFWRIDQEDFVITEVAFIESETQDALDITAPKWVEMAVREEARLNGYSKEEVEEILAAAEASFELLAVIKGKVEYYY